MGSLNEKLDNLQSTLERENARHDDILRHRPGWWHVGKLVLGCAFIARSGHLALQADSVDGYAIALLFFAGGAFFAYESVSMLRERRCDATSS
ncbi:hypothetical protein [Hyphomicrobium sp.]|uniref:hypothetical protein n=1 Tax=Hyphomicrobium sp. TaxID=82 RepID=UPI002E368A50|nr:hypothetical protein [Hyphomicrobium sp.]HEX2840810.1 hypothetical protein [Hyphomicrobium sp.]